jgi:hypothetical protein
MDEGDPHRQFAFDFGVSRSNPIQPGACISASKRLIGGGFGGEPPYGSFPYSLAINGTVEDGQSFTFTWEPPGDEITSNEEPQPPAVFSGIDQVRNLYFTTLYFPADYSNLVFGKPSSTVEAGLEELTINTTLPDIPRQMATYRVVRPVVDETYARELAARIGFGGEPEFHDVDTTWRFYLGTPNTDGAPVLSIYENGSLVVWYDRDRSKPESLPSDEECIDIASKWLEARDLYPEFVIDTRLTRETLTMMRGMEAMETYTSRKIVSFVIGLDGYELFGMGAFVIIGDEGKIVEIHINSPDFEPGPYITVMTPDTALVTLEEYLVTRSCSAKKCRNAWYGR